MRRIPLFVYGTLLQTAVLRAVIGRVPRAHAAKLRDHRRHALRGHPYPGLLPEAGECTAGALIEVSVRELLRLDRYESDFYERRPVVLTLDDGTRRRAQTYVLGAPHRGLATGRAWRALPGRERLPGTCASA